MTTQRFTLPLPSAQILRVDIDPARIHQFRAATASLVTDIGAALAALDDCAVTVQPRDWTAAHERYLASTVIGPDRGQRGVDPAQVIRAMAKALPEDAILCSEAGGYATFLHQHWLFRHPHTQAAPTTGTMGFAVPAAVAAKLAQPARCAVALVGDGGFLMNGQEIETAVRLRLALIVVVFNNRLLSGGGYLQNREYARISDVDFAAYAHAFGAQGITVRDTASLDTAFAQARAADGVVVIDVKTDPDVATPGHTTRLSPD